MKDDSRAKSEVGTRQYSFVQNLKNYIVEFCREGSLHGIKYLAQKRTLFEKIWWGISLIVSLYLCIMLVLNVYNKWENSPVIVSFASKETPNWQIPFPAITICPETKSLPKKFDYARYLDLKKNNEQLDPREEAKFGYLSLLCKYEPDIKYESEGTPFSAQEVYEFLDDVQPNFFQTISNCKFMGMPENCSNLFSPIITDEGICYTFNLLGREQLFSDNVVHFKDYHKAPKSNWSINGGYAQNDGTVTYPRRALFAGAIFAVEGILTVNEEELDYVCGSSIQGFKVQLNHPGRIPRVKQQHFRVPLDQVIVAAVSPDITTTSEAIKNYVPRKRNCYFPNERPLKYFKYYTQQNCQVECKTNYTLKSCGCINFYMPRENDTQICSGSKINCIYESEQKMLLSGIDKKLKWIRDGTTSKAPDECDCMPLCTSMYYKVENSQSPWDWKHQYNSSDRGKHMSLFQIFFKGNQFVTMDRNELFGATDFLANCGGLLGLFIGFSLLSLIEMIYYATLRIWCNIKLFGKRNWSGKIE